MGKLLVRLPEELHADFKSVVAQEHSSIQAQVQSWVEAKVREAEKKGVLGRRRHVRG